MEEYRALGMMELKSIAHGYEAADQLAKTAAVEYVTVTAACPGKFIIIIRGSISGCVPRWIRHSAYPATMWWTPFCWAIRMIRYLTHWSTIIHIGRPMRWESSRHGQRPRRW